MAAASIWVRQQLDKQIKGTGDGIRLTYNYVVEHARNIVSVHVGEELTEEQVEGLIALGVDVDVTGAS